MQDFIEDFRQAVEHGAAALLRISDAASAVWPAPGKWSAREVVGHLIDSACNNHRRFIEAQRRDDLVFDGYAQEDWVRLQHYQDASWPALVALWRAYNLHLAYVMAQVPEDVRRRPHRRHTLHRIAFHPVPEGEPATLEDLMRDYVAHLHHHLGQVGRLAG